MTREIKGFFDKLYLSESVLGKVRLDDTQLRIPISGLFLLGGHPLESEGPGPYRGELVFDGVVESRRTITEYVGDSHNPEGFKQPRELIDEISFWVPVAADTFDEFAFEGYQELPSAWVDNWVIRAKSFMLKI